MLGGRPLISAAGAMLGGRSLISAAGSMRRIRNPRT
jgi:hypothetical protein